MTAQHSLFAPTTADLVRAYCRARLRDGKPFVRSADLIEAAGADAVSVLRDLRRAGVLDYMHSGHGGEYLLRTVDP